MICETGDNIIAHPNLYGGTVNMFKVTLKRLGIECRFVGDKKWGEFKDLNDAEAIEKMIDEKTKCVFIESQGNPC